MKKTLLVVFSFFAFGISYAQADSIFTFNESLNNISIGYDFKNLRKLKNNNQFGPMHIKYEHAFSKNIGIGAVSYFHQDNNHIEHESLVFPNGEHVAYNTYEFGFAFIPKVNWHFNIEHFKNKKIKNFDFYVGAGIGYGYGRKKYDYLMKEEGVSNYYVGYQDKTNTYHYVATEINLGVRYYALNNFGVYFEMGFGMSSTQLGLIYKW